MADVADLKIFYCRNPLCTKIEIVHINDIFPCIECDSCYTAESAIACCKYRSDIPEDFFEEKFFSLTQLTADLASLLL